MDNTNQKEDLKDYRRGKLTILELMTVLAALGILLTWVLKHFLGN